MAVIPFEDHAPDSRQALFLAPDAWIIGKVKLAELVSIFFGSVLRGDIHKIQIGKGSNIQEHSMLHTSNGLGDCLVGENVTVGHRAIIHGAHVGNNCIIGMGATVLDQAEVGENCIIGANSLVSMRTKIPPGTMAYGSPAKVIRDLTESEIKEILLSAIHYQRLGKAYREHFESGTPLQQFIPPKA